MERTHDLIIVVIVAIVTIALRFLPFIIFNGKRTTPKTVSYLGDVLPAAIMAMLVVYCCKGISFREAAGFLPQLIAGFLVVVSYVWKRNTLLSIISGTICYMLLVQLVF